MSGSATIPGVLFFLAGMAAAALTGRRRGEPANNRDTEEELRAALAALTDRMAASQAKHAERVAQIESTLHDHAAKLAALPSMPEIVKAMDDLLSATMASLQDRLKEQSESIEVLRTTISSTDILLERVQESLDALNAADRTAR